MRSREWIEVRKYINELTREAREIETRIEAEGAGVGTVRRA
ncbi:hypothetical protein [Tropicimonas sp. IMCC6043]|nr:hypothetical protein [Tropicimonas sp. IMCC6043]